MFNIDGAREFLKKAEILLDDEEMSAEFNQSVNISDCWQWGCCDSEYVSDEELPEVARLFYTYGFCGVLYWASEKRDGCKSEFAHINRVVGFVRKEEEIRKSEPSISKYAYVEREYTIGTGEKHEPGFMSPKKACSVLNNILDIDPDAMKSLAFHRVGCNCNLSDHPTLQVRHDGDNKWSVGMLGIVNALCGSGEGGRGFVAAEVQSESGDIDRFVTLSPDSLKGSE